MKTSIIVRTANKVMIEHRQEQANNTTQHNIT